MLGEIEEERRCPYCGIVMSSTKSIGLHGKLLSFPYSIYLCYRHGYFVWRGRNGYTLADFSKLEKEAEIKQLTPEAKEDEYAKSPIIELKCYICNYKWKQYTTPWLISSKTIFCPDCKAELDKDKTLMKK
ncbi:MAG: hypothetical protein QXY96_06405 [Candidatus Methanomethylicaceae archaeon]